MANQHAPILFGKYSLMSRLAQGGMAELFLATSEDAPTRGPLVLKRILPHYSSELEFVKMFLNEARIAAQLAHPNIIQIFDLGQESGHFYLAMEFVDGHDLETIAKKAGGTIPPLLAARIGAWIADALYYANKNLNVIHRDVTPGNVMLGWNGAVKLVDFGIAKATDQLEKTRPGVVKGKFRYMSPEQIAQLELDGRTDLFSLGVLLYEITTNQKPFDRKQILQTLQALQTYNPPPPHEIIPNFPEPLSRIIMRALEKNRDKRYRNGREMHHELEEFLRTVPPIGPGEIAGFLRRVFPNARPEPATDPVMSKPVPPPPPRRPSRVEEPATSQISPADTRRLLQEAERRHTRNQRAVQAPVEQRTSQMTADELKRELAALNAPVSVPADAPLPVVQDDDDDWDERTGLLGAEDLADVRESSGARRLAPPTPTPPPRPAVAPRVVDDDDDDERTEATSPDRVSNRRKSTTGSMRAPRQEPLIPPKLETSRPPIPNSSFMDEDLSITETTATDRYRPRKSGKHVAAASPAPAPARSSKVLVIGAVLALAAVGVLAWALRGAF